ncbi:DUF1080 domain-containing protein [Luteolibacter algae]|uniref:DUF1080 domain-containing protein n=1 Tax=Luteolibacter algae TaxID=454151 RepID=A0ABW5DD41_9BACT
MKKILLSTLVFTTAASLLSAEDAPRPLFDGKSLTGWHIPERKETDKDYATKENFFVKDGAIHCYQLPNKKGGIILTDEEFSEFELEMDFKSDWGCDSGIFIHCNEQGQGIQILNDYLKDGCVGFGFGSGMGGFISRPILLNEVDGKIVARDSYDAVEKDGLLYAIDASGWNKMWKTDDWNRIRIRCVGDAPHITTWINGVKVMEMDGTTYKARSLKDETEKNWDAPSAWDSDKVRETTGGKGSIALQIHVGGRWKQGGSAAYRNITIKELDSKP